MKTIFVTGTDTNVGKSVVTALALAHLTRMGAKVKALKPFCSGERTDALLLWELQERTLSLDEVNPFYFDRPVSPWTAARANGREITMGDTIKAILPHTLSDGYLLIEGAGGLMSPLGERFHAGDLIAELRGQVILVAANRLGVINHTLLTLEALEKRQLPVAALVLNDLSPAEPVMDSNEQDLRILLPDLQTIRIPFIEQYTPDAERIRIEALRHERTLARLLIEQGKKNPPDTVAEGTFP